MAILPIKYCLKHWRGEYSLKFSFWFNYVLISALLIIPILLIGVFGLNQFISPQNTTKYTLYYLLFGYICYIWQLVGTCRACVKHIYQTGNKLWPNIARFILVLGTLWMIYDFYAAFPNIKHMIMLGFSHDKYSNYQFQTLNKGKTIYVKGTFGFGFYDDFKKYVDSNKNICEIVLDSNGGRVFEALKLSEYIRKNSLTTYASKKCSSACTIAFISGKERYLIDGASLGFHAFNTDSEEAYSTHYIIQTLQKRVLELFDRQGVEESFLKEIFSTSPNDMWYPTTQELLNSSVITKVCKAEDIIPQIYGEVFS